jgi:hypothetical protein
MSSLTAALDATDGDVKETSLIAIAAIRRERERRCYPKAINALPTIRV